MKMSEKQEKGITLGLVVCFVVMIAIVGAITFNQYQRGVEEQKLVQAEKEDETKQTTNEEHIQAQIELDVPAEEMEIEIEVEPVIEEKVFSKNDSLLWPIAGDVLLNYSMNQTIYFATLDQYKYNPAIIISGNVGDEVRAAATGKVTAIENNAQTGMTVTMDLGGGFELVIGQLEEIRVKIGDTVNKGEVIGHVAEPSKYYVVEGPNVYFQMLKDGKPVNPLEYMGA